MSETLVRVGKVRDLEVAAGVARGPRESQSSSRGEEDHPVAGVDVDGIVCGQHDRDAAVCEQAQYGQHLGRCRRVEPGGWLVEA
jgi:hypothetical protein